jgi:hypothetical protein
MFAACDHESYCTQLNRFPQSNPTAGYHSHGCGSLQGTFHYFCILGVSRLILAERYHKFTSYAEHFNMFSVFSRSRVPASAMSIA